MINAVPQNMYKMKVTDKDIDRIIEMAWEDRTTFEAIEIQFGLQEKEVIELMAVRQVGDALLYDGFSDPLFHTPVSVLK